MKGPMFHGQPSPALRRMQYLTPAELRDYLANLKVERDRITARLATRKKAGAKTDHDVPALRLERRLGELIEQGRRYWTAQGGGGEGNSRPAPQPPTLSSRYLGRRA